MIDNILLRKIIKNLYKRLEQSNRIAIALSRIIILIRKSKIINKIFLYYLFKLLIFYKELNNSSMNSPVIALDVATKFHDYIYLYGWFFSDKKLDSIKIISNEKLHYIVSCNIPHEGVINLGLNLGFKVSILCETAVYPDELTLEFRYDNKVFKCFAKDLIASRINKYDMSAKQDFDIFLATNKNLKILDIGGRDRSKVDRSKFYGSNHDVSVIDIIDGDNVDIVGDAHSLSSYFPVNTFDVLVSTSVFEHLHSPWKAAVEMNKILKMGGIALVQTHQTLGMHDIPWDFWRFSDQAWKAIFNSKTGYEILKTNMTHESFILPFLFRRDKVDAEKSAGFELSTVLVRKIGESILDWDVNTSEISNQNYPMTEDGFNPDEMEIVFK